MIHYARPLASVSDLLDHARMEKGLLTNAEVRRRRLVQLASHVGGLDVIATGAKVSAQNLDHIVKKRRQSKERADGTKPIIDMGDQLARKIEEAFSLTPGWLDWPFEHVDFDAFAKMNREQMAMVQQRLSDAIREQVTGKTPQMEIPEASVVGSAPPAGRATSAAARRSVAVRSSSTGKLGDGNEHQTFLLRVEDPENAIPSKREARLHRRIEKYPKSSGK